MHLTCQSEFSRNWSFGAISAGNFFVLPISFLIFTFFFSLTSAPQWLAHKRRPGGLHRAAQHLLPHVHKALRRERELRFVRLVDTPHTRRRISNTNRRAHANPTVNNANHSRARHGLRGAPTPRTAPSPALSRHIPTGSGPPRCAPCPHSLTLTLGAHPGPSAQHSAAQAHRAPPTRPSAWHNSAPQLHHHDKSFTHTPTRLCNNSAASPLRRLAVSQPEKEAAHHAH